MQPLRVHHPLYIAESHIKSEGRQGVKALRLSPCPYDIEDLKSTSITTPETEGKDDDELCFEHQKAQELGFEHEKAQELNVEMWR